MDIELRRGKLWRVTPDESSFYPLLGVVFNSRDNQFVVGFYLLFFYIGIGVEVGND